MLKRLTAVTVWIVTSSFFMAVALPVLAQADKEEASAAPESKAWVAFLFAIVLGAGIAVGCFMTPKRTHLD